MSIKQIKQSLMRDESALDTLVRDYYPKVYRTIYYRVLDEALAKDLTQETFYQFFSHMQEYEERGKLLNYLYRIALHLIYDHTKKKQPLTVELLEETLQDSTFDGRTQFIGKEDAIILWKWVMKLPIHLQDVILLRYVEGLKYKDISNITGIHVSTIKSQVKLALSMLEQQARKENWK